MILTASGRSEFIYCRRNDEFMFVHYGPRIGIGDGACRGIASESNRVVALSGI
jgi:hypothetical protein